MSLKKDNVKNIKINNNDNINTENGKESKNSRLAALLDSVHKKNLEQFYQKENSDFINKIDKLNLQFYLETENYLNYKNDREKCQNKLFIILFKQINLYISEVERLNKFIKNNFSDLNFFLSANNNNNNKKNYIYENIFLKTNETPNDFSTLEEKEAKKILEAEIAYVDKSRKSQLFRANLDDSVLNPFNVNSYSLEELKVKYKNLEKKLVDKITNEQKLNFEIKNLKRQIKFYSEKLQLEIENNKSASINNNNNNNSIFLRNTINPNMNYNFQKNFMHEKFSKSKLNEDLEINKNKEIKNDKINFDFENASDLNKKTFINNYKNCDIININNNTYNTIITGNNGSRESSNAKSVLDAKAFGYSEDNKKSSSIDKNFNNDNNNNLGNSLALNCKIITIKDSNLNNARSILNVNNNNNNNNHVKREKTEKTIFTSIISNSDNININPNTQINPINNNNNNNNKTNNNSNNNLINLNQNSVIRNSSSNKNLIAGIKTGTKFAPAGNKQQFGARTAVKIEKANQASNNLKPSAKKRNYSDNNPQQQQQINTNEINSNHNNSNNNNNKNAFLKTINFNTRYSFIEQQKPSKNLSPKNILDVYNSNKIKHNSNKESLNSANLNTHINSNSNGNSISSNPFQKNQLSESLSDAKISAFNKHSSINPSNGSINVNVNVNSNCINNGKNSSGKELRIVNAIKQSASIDTKKPRTAKSHSHTIKLHNFDFSSMKISNQQETKDLQEMIINNFNYFEDEFQEINDLESQLIFLRENLGVEDYPSGNPVSIELFRKTTIVSDIEDGYKSGNSFASEKTSNFSSRHNSNSNPPLPSAFIKSITVTPRVNAKEKSVSSKFPILTSVTIDLNKI